MNAPVGPQAPSAKERLQATRQALMHELVPSTRNETARELDDLAYVQELQERRDKAQALGLPPPEEDELPPSARPPVSSARSGWFSLARHSLRAWWEFHPVRVAGAVAQPVLAEYARQRPLKTMGIAAGLGALIVVTRPWRLVSVGGLAVAALKSSQVSNFALSLLSSRQNNRKDPR